MLPVAEKVPEAAASAGLAAAAPASSSDPAAVTTAIIFLTADHLLRPRSRCPGAGGCGESARQAAAGSSHRHRDVSGGWLRPAVLGAVDGVATNASLIAGVGGGVPAHAVVLTGVAALVAGAFSMGTGEDVSVTNQNELVHAEVALERRMHARFPAAEEAELADYFRGYGADPDTVTRMAAAVLQDPAPHCAFTRARNSASTWPTCHRPSPSLSNSLETQE